MTHHQHTVCVVIVVLGVLCNFALNVENNESRLVHLPREEFVKVMSDILSGGDKNTPSVVEGSNEDEDDEFYDSMDPAGASWYQNSQRGGSTGRSSARSGRSSASNKSSTRTAMEETPRTTATKQAQHMRGGSTGVSISETLAGPSAGTGGTNGVPRARRVKSDSLYFLQRSMEARESAYRSGGVPGVNAVDGYGASGVMQSNNYPGSV